MCSDDVMSHFEEGNLKKQFGKGTIFGEEEGAFVSSPTDALETRPALLPYRVELTRLGADSLI